MYFRFQLIYFLFISESSKRPTPCSPFPDRSSARTEVRCSFLEWVPPSKIFPDRRPSGRTTSTRQIDPDWCGDELKTNQNEMKWKQKWNENYFPNCQRSTPKCFDWIWDLNIICVFASFVYTCVSNSLLQSNYKRCELLHFQTSKLNSYIFR